MTIARNIRADYTTAFGHMAAAVRAFTPGHSGTGIWPSLAAPLFIAGMPRSGTTWLAKTFDSHPLTFYLHEPDQAVTTNRIPPYCDQCHLTDNIPAATDYLARVLAVRTAKAAGSLPAFDKDYRSAVAGLVRNGLIGAIKAGERILSSRWPHDIGIPDLADRSGGTIQPVVKSVRALGHLALLLAAAPGSRAIVIIRSAPGHVASVMRKLADDPTRPTEDVGIYQDLAATEQARRYGLTTESLLAMPPVARLTWRWVVCNEKAIDDAAAFGLPIRVVRYEDLCLDTDQVARELFAFAGLPWMGATARFVAASTAASGQGRYYGVFHNPRRSAFKWREEMASADIATVLSIAKDTRAGALFADDQAAVS